MQNQNIKENICRIKALEKIVAMWLQHPSMRIMLPTMRIKELEQILIWEIYNMRKFSFEKFVKRSTAIESLEGWLPYNLWEVFEKSEKSLWKASYHIVFEKVFEKSVERPAGFHIAFRIEEEMKTSGHSLQNWRQVAIAMQNSCHCPTKLFSICVMSIVTS